jgi:hypothetical protein
VEKIFVWAKTGGSTGSVGAFEIGFNIIGESHG